ncbi:MAG: substrate-binding domain-containing protein [Geobacter sp.]|nr:substrate-binding domain-containing protein [Geobacter sp.]
MRHFRGILWCISLFVTLVHVEAGYASQVKPALLIYCGTTMLRPMQDIARIFEQREGVKVSFVQGGSADLYKSAAKSRLGDLYLPGEASFRHDNLKDGLLGEYRLVGYNRLALMVQKGNPKKVQPDPRQLLRKDLQILLSGSDTCSSGRATKRLFTEMGVYNTLLKKAVMVLPDSRAIATSMRRGDADAVITWKGTILFTDGAKSFEIIDLPGKWGSPQELVLTLFTFSKQPVLARKFMDLAAGAEGQEIFAKNGFGKLL